MNIKNIKFTDDKILTGDPYKGTYIEPLSQRPPSNSTFLRTLTVPRKWYFSHGTSSCTTHLKLREHQIPIKQCSKKTNLSGVTLMTPKRRPPRFPPDKKNFKKAQLLL